MTDKPKLTLEEDQKDRENARLKAENLNLGAQLGMLRCILGKEGTEDSLLDAARELRGENARLRAELSLRTMLYPPSEIPREFRVRGQHAAYHSGFEHAWRGHPRENCYEFHTAQHRAWDRGFADGASAFAAAFAATLEAKSE